MANVEWMIRLSGGFRSDILLGSVGARLYRGQYFAYVLKYSLIPASFVNATVCVGEWHECLLLVNGSSFIHQSKFMAKYSKKAGKKVARAMHERKKGTLKSGRSGKKVTSGKQAIAIGLSEAREEGAKVPRKKASKKKAAAKKPVTRKAAKKKAAPKSSSRRAKKTAGRKKSISKK